MAAGADPKPAAAVLGAESLALLGALEGMREGVAVFDDALRLVACSDRFRALGGYPAGLCRAGTAYAEFVRSGAERCKAASTDIEETIIARCTLATAGAPATFEEQRTDGAMLSFSLQPRADGGIVLTCLDASERVGIERALEESQQMLRALTDEAPISLALIDANDQLTYTSRQNADFAGRPLEELLGRGWEADIHPDDLPWMSEFLREQLGKQQRYELEYRGRRHDGVYRWIREVGVPHIAPDGSFAGFVAAQEDVTEKRAAMAEVARQREALHQSEKLSALGSLLAGVAHELNNPLSVVAGQAQLLQEMTRDPKTAARAVKIRNAAERCAKIVKSFLAMARRRPPERAPVELNRLVEATLEIVGYGLRTAGVAVELDLAADLPSSWADGDQLQQVVANLVVNAQQAMADGEGERRLRIVTRFDAGDNQLRLEVIDSGPGVPPAIRSRIFEPFFTTKPAGVGTGVGLSLCHGIVESHGGSIAIEDAPEGGARFVVRLPFVAAAPGTVDPGQAPAARAAESQSILVVDDEADIAEILADILAEAGHRVDTVSSGKAALERIAQRDYRLVVSDLRMPELDGPGLYRALQARDPAWAGRVIFVTGDTLSEAAATFLDRAKRPCIEKPFNADEVRRVVAEALHGAAAAAPAYLPSAGLSSGTKT